MIRNGGYMKSGIANVLGIVLLCGIVIAASPVYAQSAKGGVGPMLGSCCLGPRIGLEMNEGQEIELIEFALLLDNGVTGGLIRLWLAYDYGYKAAGNKGFLASCCIGPRVGKEFNERKIRDREFLYPIPIVNLYPWITIGIEAYQGKTMTEIAEEENLTR